jgi:hypothetical protein
MNRDDEMRLAAGETDELPPAPRQGESESDVVRRDMTYSPGSETETQQKQDDSLDETLPDDIDKSSVTLAPGTGGPDDGGDIDVDPEDLNLPGRD